MQEDIEETPGAQLVTDAAPRGFGKLWPFLRYSFLAAIISEAALTLSNAHTFFFFKAAIAGADVSVTEGAFVDLHQAIAGFGYLTILILSIVAYCRFYYRAMKNLTLVGAADLRTTPFWSVGTFFVPVVNLWKPLSAVRQIWRGSHDPETADVKVPAMIGWWWCFWIVSNILGNISFRLMARSGVFGEEILDYDAYLGSLMMDMISAPLTIAAALLVLRFSKKIMVAQAQNVLSDAMPAAS